MGAEAFYNYAASFVAQHLHPLQFPKAMTSKAAQTATVRTTGPTAKPSTPAPTAPQRPAQQKPMTEPEQHAWAQAMGNRLKRKHEATDQKHHDYAMGRSEEVLGRVRAENDAAYRGPAGDAMRAFDQHMSGVRSKIDNFDAHDFSSKVSEPSTGTSSAPTPKPSTSAAPVSHADTHGEQFSAPATASKPSAPKRSSGGYRAKAAHEGAWDGTFPHQEPVDLSSFDHAPVQHAPAPATPSSDHFTSAARNVKFTGTMKEVGREGHDPMQGRISNPKSAQNEAAARTPRPLTPKQRSAQHGLFPVNQVKKVGKTRASKPEPEHDPRTPGPGQTSLDFGHDASAPIHNPKQFGQGHIF